MTPQRKPSTVTRAYLNRTVTSLSMSSEGLEISRIPRAIIVDAITGLPFDFAEFIRDKITMAYWNSIDEQWGREAIGL